jgi:hypothetical protein
MGCLKEALMSRTPQSRDTTAAASSPDPRRSPSQARSTAAEVALRIETVYDLQMKGVGRHGLQVYAANHGWGVSPRQLDTYARRARVQFAKAAQRDHVVELGRSLERLDLLFMRALAENDRAEARAVLKDLTELLGLGAAQRHELAGPGGAPLLSQDELAAQFRALLAAKAERLQDDGSKEQ